MSRVWLIPILTVAALISGYFLWPEKPGRLAHFENAVIESFRHPAFEAEANTTKTELVPLAEQWSARDLAKKNLCLITINSPDEGEVFTEHLKTHFNIFEFAAGPSNHYMQRACKAGVECDVLLISGHFAGSFFGETNYRLPTSEMEVMTCDPGCRGIFEKPKEVYLFGCNTLATKKPDHRTPDQYADLLVEHYQFSRAQAEEVAAFRYSPIGGEFSARMKTIFPNSRLYGYTGVGPAGPQVRQRLDHYLKSVGDFNAFFETFDPINGPDNKKLKKFMSESVFTEVRGVGQTRENPSCILGDPKRTVNDRLLWINQVFNDEKKRLQFLPIINEWMDRLQANFSRGLPDAEQGFLDRIQFNVTAKKAVLKHLDKPVAGLVTTQLGILNFSRKVGWVIGDDYVKRGQKLLRQSFRKNLERSEADMICSWDGKFDLTPDALPKRPWTAETLRAMKCLQVKDPETLKLLTQDLSSPPLRGIAIEILALSGSEDPMITDAVLKLFNDPDPIAPYHALNFIQRRQKADRGVILQIANLPLSQTSAAGQKAIETLIVLRAFDQEVQNIVLQILKSKPLPAVAQGARDYFLATKTQDSEIHHVMGSLVQNAEDPRVAGLMVQALGELKTPYLDLQMLLAEGAASVENSASRALFIKALQQILPTDTEVHRELAKGLSHAEPALRLDCFKLLTSLKPSDARLRFQLWRFDPEEP